MARRGSSETLSEDVYLQLRADVLAGRLLPGEPLKPGELRLRFSVSVAVVREALTRLAEQGLARSQPNRGFAVTPISQADLTALLEARAINDAAALRASIEHGSVAWESHVLAAHHRLARTTEYDPEDSARVTDEWAAAHSEFHFTLLEACGNPILLDICARLWSATELYRRWSLTRDAGRDLPVEHDQLMRSAIDRNVETAVARLQAHMRRTADALRESKAAG